MKQLKSQNFGQLSEISGNDVGNNDSFSDLIENQQLRQDQYLKSKIYGDIAQFQIQGVQIADESIKRSINNCFSIIQEKELQKQIPQYGLIKNLQLMEKVCLISLGIQDDNKKDYKNDAFVADQEPDFVKQDQWIRQKIQVDVKQEFTIEQVASLPQSNNLKSKGPPSQQSIKSSAVGGGQIKSKNQLSQSNGGGVQNSSKLIEKSKIPEAIDLYEAPIISDEEENLRQEKDLEKKRMDKVQNQEKQKRIKAQSEEQLKFQKFQKENKTSVYTYDYDGGLLPVQKIQVQRLPPSTYSMGFGFKDEQLIIEKKKNKKKDGGKDLRLKKQSDSDSQQGNPYSQQQIQSTQPAIESVQLQSGVTIILDGVRRQGPRPMTVDFGQLTTGDGKIRLAKKQLDEIIQKQAQQQQQSKLDQERLFMQSAGGVVGKQGGQQKDLNKDYQDSFIDGMSNINFLSLGGLNNKKNYRGDSRGSEGGGIKINSNKIYETMTINMISEEEEILMRMEKSQLEKKQLLKKQKSETQNQFKNAIDNFNYALAFDREWGKKHNALVSGQSLQSYSFGQHKATEKQIQNTLGNTSKPRERHPQTPSSSQNIRNAFLLRANTSQENLRNNLINNKPQTPQGLPSIQFSKTSQGTRK